MILFLLYWNPKLEKNEIVFNEDNVNNLNVSGIKNYGRIKFRFKIIETNQN